jgi:hypothetical protein
MDSNRHHTRTNQFDLQLEQTAADQQPFFALIFYVHGRQTAKR